MDQQARFAPKSINVFRVAEPIEEGAELDRSRKAIVMQPAEFSKIENRWVRFLRNHLQTALRMEGLARLGIPINWNSPRSRLNSLSMIDLLYFESGLLTSNLIGHY